MAEGWVQPRSFFLRLRTKLWPAQFPRTPETMLTEAAPDTRFFIIKSFNEENVEQCMEDGLWASQEKNREVLTTAFAQCQNVILFFSVNLSRAFQGYARMSTAPSPDTPQPRWMKKLHWDSTQPFRIEWLSTVTTPFDVVHHIHNPLNEDQRGKQIPSVAYASPWCRGATAAPTQKQAVP